MTEALSTLQQVKEFHQAFKQPLVDGGPSLSAIEERIPLRMALIAEEFIELVEAVYGKEAGAFIAQAYDQAVAADDHTRDLVETADALGDMKYVIDGFAVEANIDLDAVSTHIHESNMSKLGEDGEPIMSDGVTPDRDGVVKPKGKILKSDKFWAPDLRKLLLGTE